MRERLVDLDRQSRTAFAASCAERLLPLFERYARSVGTPESGSRLRAAIDAAWDAASGLDVNLETYRSEVELLVPSDAGEWTLEAGYGQNAAAAAAYALRTWLTDDPQEAVWAARQVYELADYAALQGGSESSLNAPGAEALVLASGPVQHALAAIDGTLDAVEARPSSWRALRAEAEADGRSWESALP
ncbi:DUF416 family protein [Demequina soli]|uniref:DUF416 family protein n=1 Tax=Demequina soli TaxID=1638987 RepID=UPI0034E25914